MYYLSVSVMSELENISAELLKKIEHRLLEIRLDNPAPAGWSQQSIPYLQKCLDRIYQLVVKYPFQKRSEEIYFFKYTKPAVMAQLIFMSEVHNAEIFRPSRRTPAQEKDYLADALDDVDAFFKKYEGLYDYYKQKHDGYDITFFVRDVEDRLNFRDLPIEVDPVYFYGPKDFSTGFDYMFAKFRAYEMLRDHLENELEALLIVGEVPPEEINFTGSTADFVQMVEIFKAVGRPEDPETGGPATDQQMFDLLKQAFNPNLPNGVNFDTLKLISGGSDLAVRMADSIERLRKQWEDEERDIDYGKNNPDEPK